MFYRASRCDVPREVLDIKQFEDQIAYSEKHVIRRLGFTYNYKHVSNFPMLFFVEFPVLLKYLDLGISLLKKLFFGWPKTPSRGIAKLDFFACGDFTLMSKEDWLKIDGYYELEKFPLHVDSLALIAAYASGMEQFTFPASACTYHIYHEEGWSSDYNDMEAVMNITRRRQGLSWGGIYRSGEKLLKLNRPYQLNNPNWGFHALYFEEYTF